MKCYVWVDGQKTLYYGLPVNLSSTQAKVLNGGHSWVQDVTIHESISLLKRIIGIHGRTLVDTNDWPIICESVDLPANVADALWSLSYSAEKQLSWIEDTISLISVARILFLASMENHFLNHPLNKMTDSQCTRTTYIFEFVKTYCREFFELHFTASGETLPTRFYSPFEESLAPTDTLLEGLLDESDGLLPFSQIIEFFFPHQEWISLISLVDFVKEHLCPDPFAIDDVPIGKMDHPPTVPSKKTSLSEYDRRKVFVSEWNRIEVLRRSVYSEAHLRISSHREMCPRFIQPFKSRSIIISGLKNCDALITGPVQGIVYVQNVRDTAISTMCYQLIMFQCENVVVNSCSLTPPIIRSCKDITFGPYNTYYDNMSEEQSFGLSLHHNKDIKKPILLDNSTFSIMPPNDFYVEPLPIEQKNSQDEQIFFASLPTGFASSWKLRVQQCTPLCAECSTIQALSEKDEKYLRSKIGAFTDLQ